MGSKVIFFYGAVTLINLKLFIWGGFDENPFFNDEPYILLAEIRILVPRKRSHTLSAEQ